MRSEFVRSVSTLIYSCLVFLFCLQSIRAERPQPKEQGIWCDQHTKYQLAGNHKELLVASLRRITGYQELNFSNNGALSLGDPGSISEGSQMARTILQQVLNTGSEVVIEDHSNSQSVNFGQLDEGTRYEDWVTRKNFTIWHVRIDFEDFRKMQTSPEVQEAFDSGITTLHELLHSLGHKDPDNFGEVGKCEEVINQVRTELSLPVREHYHGVPLIQLSNQSVIIRVRFRERLAAKVAKIVRPTRWKTHYLFFVMALTDESSSALIGLRK